jgi:pimeloyl-ACP methyl ester carboxylesterase
MHGANTQKKTGRVTTLVLLHGLFGDPSNWAQILPALSPQYRVLTPKLPVHRDNRNGAQSIPQLTEFVREFLDERGVERAILCGNSLGGQVALDFCLRYPARAERLVLSGSAGLYERSLTSGSPPRVCKEFIRDQGRKIFYNPEHMTEEMVEEIFQALRDRDFVRFLLRIAKATRDYNMKELLPHVRVPTLLIWGAQDEVTPPHVAHEFESHIPGAKLVFLDECGHAPPIEQPQRFGQVLRAFLDDEAPAVPIAAA